MKNPRHKQFWEKINYKNKWPQHVRRMDRSRLPNVIMKYQSAVNINPGLPLKRTVDCHVETGAEQKAPRAY